MLFLLLRRVKDPHEFFTGDRFLFIQHLCQLIQQRAEKTDPFHAPEGMFLIAGILHQRRNTEFLQLFHHLRGVVDHRIFDGHAAVLG